MDAEKPIDAHAEILDFIAKNKVKPYCNNLLIIDGQFFNLILRREDDKFFLSAIHPRRNLTEYDISVFLESLRLADLL